MVRPRLALKKTAFELSSIRRTFRLSTRRHSLMTGIAERDGISLEEWCDEMEDDASSCFIGDLIPHR